MKTLYSKLLQIQTLGIRISKDSINPHFKNKYASLDNIIDGYTKPLSDHGIIIYHQSDLENNVLITRLIESETSESITTSFPINYSSNPQQIASQLTYAKRYNLGLLLNIATDEDDDGNRANESKKELTIDILNKFYEKYPESTAEQCKEKLKQHYNTKDGSMINEFYQFINKPILDPNQTTEDEIIGAN